MPAGKRRVGSADLAGQFLQRDAVERELLEIGSDTDALVRRPDQIGQADIVDLGDLHPQFPRDLRQLVRRDARGEFRIGRQREVDDGDVVDAAPDDQRLGDADGDLVEIGADLLVDPDDGGVGRRADLEAGGDHDAVVAGLGIDMLDAVDAAHDAFERLGDQLDGVRRLEAVGRHMDIDHRHRDLRVFLPRQGDERHQPHGEGCEQQERRQRGIDEDAGEIAGDAEPR